MSDETVTNAARLARLAHVVATFADVPRAAYIAAYATEDGGTNGVSYGDIAALVRLAGAAQPTLELRRRIIDALLEVQVSAGVRARLPYGQFADAVLAVLKETSR
jgi:hypothetical protein